MLAFHPEPDADTSQTERNPRGSGPWNGRKSILVATESFPNPLQSYVLNSLEEILRRGARVTIVAGGRLGQDEPERVGQLGLTGGTRYFPFDSLFGTLRSFQPYLWPFAKPGREAYRGLWTLATSRRWRPTGLRRFIKAMAEAPLLAGGHFDLVHAHNLVPAYEFLMVPQVLDIPLLTTFHGLPTIKGSGILTEGKKAELFHCGDLFLANTRFARRQLEQAGCPSHKIRILPQGLRLVDFPFRPKSAPTSDPIVLLTVARLSIDKGHRYALEAVGRLRERVPRLEYRIVGAGPYRKELEEAVRQFDLAGCVRFLGPLMGVELRRQYAEAHVFLLPSVTDPSGIHLTETQGVVMQEAQASGLIVIASQTGGIPECVEDGKSAFLVPERDAQSLAAKITWVLDHSDQWPAWQRAGRKWVEDNFASEQIGKRLWDVYDELLEPRRARHA